MQDLPEHHGWCGRLYEEQAANLLLYARTFGLTHSESEDVVQEVFAALLKLSEEPERASHYAVRAIRNRALNFKRSFLRRMLRELESDHWFDAGPAEAPGEREAMRCLETLPAEQREVIVLKVWHGHTFEEIGELTGCSANTAAGRYRYGLHKMRHCLNKEFYEADGLFRGTDALLDPTLPFPRS